MAIFVFAHTQVGKDAAYMQAKLEAIINTAGISTIINPKNPANTSAISQGFKEPKTAIYLDPALDTTKTIDQEKNLTLAKCIQNYDARFSAQATGGTVRVWDGLMWIFIVPDANFAAVQALAAAIKAIV